MQKLRKLIWNVLHRNTIYDRIEDRVEIVEVIKTVPGEKGSPYVNVTGYGIIYNKLVGELVRIKRTSGAFDNLIVTDVKLEGAEFYVQGRIMRDDGEQANTTKWIHESNVYMNVFW